MQEKKFFFKLVRALGGVGGAKTDVKKGRGIASRRKQVFCIREVFGVRGVTSSAPQDHRKNLEGLEPVVHILGSRISKYGALP